jgi:aminoglycoside 3'-phosphotransferase II
MKPLILQSLANKTPIQTGKSGAGVYRIDGKPWILKIQKSQDALFPETQKMQWLESHSIPVPNVIEYAQDEDHEYLLITQLAGQDASLATDPKAAVRALALGLQRLHSLPTDCPFDRRLDKTLLEAQQHWQNGNVDESDFDPSRLGTDVVVLYQHLLKQRPQENLVFTHGDYCLPNIILENNTISGFIDLGRAGLADACQDLALMTRSLETKTNPRFLGLSSFFLEVYGARPDHDKLEYYRILDEFF